MEKGMNAQQNSYKVYNFTLTVYSIEAMLSGVQDNCGWPLPEIELVVSNVRRMSLSLSRAYHLCRNWMMKAESLKNY